MPFEVTKPRRFVGQWMHFHKLNIIAVKQLFYVHKFPPKKTPWMGDGPSYRFLYTSPWMGDGRYPSYRFLYTGIAVCIIAFIAIQVFM